MELMKLSHESKVIEWNQCIRNATQAKMALEEEITRATRNHVSAYLRFYS